MFTSDASQFLSSFFDFMSRLFSLTVPGTTVSFFGLFAGCLVTLFLIKLVKDYINVIGGLGGSISAGLGKSEKRTHRKDK